MNRATTDQVGPEAGEAITHLHPRQLLPFRFPSIGWTRRRKILPYLLLLPAIVAIFAVVIYPLGYGILLAFTDKQLIVQRFSFVGLANFSRLLQDPLVPEALLHSILFTFYGVVGTVLLGFAFAFLLNMGLHPQGVLRALVLIPWTICTLVTAVLWIWMYNPLYGFLDYILSVFGLPKVLFIGNLNLALFSTSLPVIWRGYPFVTLVFLAALQSLDKELFEAAAVDGATSWQQFRYLTIPLITPIAKIVILLETIWVFNTFDVVWIMTKGGPADATHLLSTYSYYNAFSRFDMGYGSAIALLLFFILIVLCTIYIRFVHFAGEG